MNSGKYQKANQFMSAVVSVLNRDISNEGEEDRVAVRKYLHSCKVYKDIRNTNHKLTNKTNLLLKI